MKDITYYGNKELLKLHKTAFFASRTIPVDKVLKCYDWAAGKHATNSTLFPLKEHFKSKCLQL